MLLYKLKTNKLLFHKALKDSLRVLAELNTGQWTLTLVFKLFSIFLAKLSTRFDFEDRPQTPQHPRTSCPQWLYPVAPPSMSPARSSSRSPQ